VSLHPKGRRAGPRDELVRGSGVSVHLHYYSPISLRLGKIPQVGHFRCGRPIDDWLIDDLRLRCPSAPDSAIVNGQSRNRQFPRRSRSARASRSLGCSVAAMPRCVTIVGRCYSRERSIVLPPGCNASVQSCGDQGG